MKELEINKQALINKLKLQLANLLIEEIDSMVSGSITRRWVQTKGNKKYKVVLTISEISGE